MSSMRALSALCVLCAVVGSAIAAEHRRAQEPQADAANVVETTNYYQPADVTNACLQEGNLYNCRTAGCQNLAECAFKRKAGAKQTTSCPDCITNFVFQSDLTCCGAAQDNPDYYSYTKVQTASTVDTPGYASPYLRIGTCDWDITVNTIDACIIFPTQSGCPGAKRQQDDNAIFAKRIGSAWATCYLTEGAELCSGALCDKMVITFQGSFYESAVKSTHQFAAYDFTPTQCGPHLTRPDNATRAEAIAEASLQQYDGYGKEAEEPTFTGIAWIMSGAITVTSVSKKVDYTSGHMDYVYDFLETPAEDVAAKFGDGEYTTVTPNTYKVNLISNKKATY